MDDTKSTDGRGVSADSTGEVILYHAADGSPAIEVRLEHDSVWLSQQQIAELFGTTRESMHHAPSWGVSRG
ncbi:hypothetical protein [Leucobacter komagatae]|uniref:hypothetical protein n=1 Tax=Leucobacter komagatae TaxID=55969 RepID=UPI001FEBA350|nr:hypothetical protein [Leucobacter komagatae]